MRSKLEKWADFPITKLKMYHSNDSEVKPIYEFDQTIFILTYSDIENNYYSWEIKEKTPMLAQLAKHYHWCLENKIKGHALGYYAEKELVKSLYEFPQGTFTLKRTDKNFCLWHYASKLA